MKFDRKLFNMLLQLAAVLLLLWWLLSNISVVLGFVGGVFKILSPFILGLCIAFVINIIMRSLEKGWCKVKVGKKAENIWHKLKRPVCIILSFIIVFGVICAIVFIVVPEFSQTIGSLMEKAPQYSSKLQGWWNELMVLGEKYALDLPNMNFDLQKIVDMGMGLLTGGGKLVINTTIGLTTSFVSGLVNFFVALIFSIYILAQKEVFGAAVKKILYAIFRPEIVNNILGFSSLVNRTFTSFVTGQLTEAVIIGSLCFIGMLIFKFPYAAVIAVLVGFTALIPVFGAFIGTGIGAFLILLDTPIKAVWFVVFILILQQLENNLIYPKVVGKSVGLPAVFVLMAVTIGASSFGIVGMLISVPTVSVIYTVFARWVDIRLKEKHIDETSI